jgi:DNA-binding XRE family transcriptional regulator
MRTADTVTLSRAEYEAMLREIEDAEDLAAVAAAEAREAALGKEVAWADYLPVELVKRLFAGEHPIAIWREHRGMTRDELAALAGIAPDCLAAIETRRNPGHFDDVAKLALALRISLDGIALWLGENQPE